MNEIKFGIEYNENDGMGWFPACSTRYPSEYVAQIVIDGYELRDAEIGELSAATRYRIVKFTTTKEVL